MFSKRYIIYHILLYKDCVLLAVVSEAFTHPPFSTLCVGTCHATAWVEMMDPGASEMIETTDP